MKKSEINNGKKSDDENYISRKEFITKSFLSGLLLNQNFRKIINSPFGFVTDFNKEIRFFKKDEYDKSKQIKYWHNKPRKLRYTPHNGGFVIVNGTKRFNRPIYGANTAFRIQAGDLPEFSLFMPGVGGTLKFGISDGNKTKWLKDAREVKTTYHPGSMIYEIKDPILDGGTLNITLLAIPKVDGAVIRLKFQNTPENIELNWAFGGASDNHFHRNGDIIGADPISGYDLLPDHCIGNEYHLKDNTFKLKYGKDQKKEIRGLFPPDSILHIVDARHQKSPFQYLKSQKSKTPALAGKVNCQNQSSYYLALYNPHITDYSSLTFPSIVYPSLPELFKKAEKERDELVNRVTVSTPDPFINSFGGALSVAANAIWEPPSYLHGAVAWRVRLNGWRGPYVADPLGWHDRAHMHFKSYSLSQLTSPASGPVVHDPNNHLARELMKLGTELYSSGYVCPEPGGHFRADHYDMNLCYIDEMLRHFKWTGDWEFVKEMWPTIKRHLAWEKRCFDADDDGLYDAYCCIWASDAIEYGGGKVTHSTAYNYYSNKFAAYIAGKIGEDPKPYQNEADKILHALKKVLWLSDKGWYAEYKDMQGMKITHPKAALWTIYHAIDSRTTDPFMAYQALRYIDTQIPHIPVRAENLKDDGYYTLSTTNWMPYMWSDNNVAMAEILHTSLAYWEAGRNEDAFKIWKSTILDNMYMGICPGNFEQLSFYDAMRGELYTDFGDPIGMAARSLVEGLFGIEPNVLKGEITIHPGFPAEWDHASLEVPDISFKFKREGNNDKYFIESKFRKKLRLNFIVNGKRSEIKKLTVNGEGVNWKNSYQAVGKPMLEIDCGTQSKYEIEIIWSGIKPQKLSVPSIVAINDKLQIRNTKLSFIKIFDPQNIFKETVCNRHFLSGIISGELGHRTIFVKVRQGDLEWWEPINFESVTPIKIIPYENQDSDSIHFKITNNSNKDIKGYLLINNSRLYGSKLILRAGKSKEVRVKENIITGSNNIVVQYGKLILGENSIENWDLKIPSDRNIEMLDISHYYNDSVTNIFKNRYLSPRSKHPALRIPYQGIGAWTSTLVTADIDDTGLRKKAGYRNKIILPQGIPFKTPGKLKKPNIIFTSQWDNYPDEVTIPLNKSASHMYLLMAGSTNWMQSRISNGEIIIQCVNGEKIRLELKNPDSWIPIEQDYYTDGYAFKIDKAKPIRLHLKTGLITKEFNRYTKIKGYTNRAIDGGSATVLDIPLNGKKKIKELTLRTLTNDSIIGLMSVTLIQ